MNLIRVAALAVSALATGVLLSACAGPNAASSAAVIGSQSVTGAALDSYVADIHKQRNQPVDQSDPTVTKASLNRLVIENLVMQSGESLGLTVSDAEAQELLRTSEENAGGRQAVVDSLLEDNIPESNLTEIFRMSVMIQKMGPVLAPDGDAQAQQQAVYFYVLEKAAELTVEVNPRYGTWNAKDLEVGDLPIDLSVPVGALPTGSPAPQPTAS